MSKSYTTVRYTNLNNTLHFINSFTNPMFPNSEFEVHTHYNEFELYYFLEGDIYFALEGKQYDVEEGSMILISDGMIHKPIIKSACRYNRKHILIDKKIFINSDVFAFDFYNVLRKKRFFIIKKEYVESLKLNTMFEQIERSLSQGTPYEDFCALISLFSLLIKIEKNNNEQDNIQIYSNNNKISEIIKFIDENIPEDLSYKAISKRFFVTEKYLYKLFKKETGFTMGNYITERRIIKAQTMLNAGASAGEAAIASGFNEYSVFYKSFLRKVGISPAKYIESLNKNS